MLQLIHSSASTLLWSTITFYPMNYIFSDCLISLDFYFEFYCRLILIYVELPNDSQICCISLIFEIYFRRCLAVFGASYKLTKLAGVISIVWNFRPRMTARCQVAFSLSHAYRHNRHMLITQNTRLILSGRIFPQLAKFKEPSRILITECWHWLYIIDENIRIAGILYYCKIILAATFTRTISLSELLMTHFLCIFMLRA